MQNDDNLHISMNSFELYVTLCRVIIYVQNILRHRSVCNISNFKLHVKKSHPHKWKKMTSLSWSYSSSLLIVSPEVLCHLHIPDKSWMLAEFLIEENGKSKIRWIQVMASPNIKDSTLCLVHPFLYENITYGNVSSEVFATLGRKDSFAEVDKRILSCWKNFVIEEIQGINFYMPQFVAEVSCCLLSRSSISEKDIEELLCNYFEEPKYLCQGDTFKIPCPKSIYSKKNIGRQLDLLMSPLVFYVNTVAGRGCQYGGLVSSSKAKMYLSSSHKSDIPFHFGFLSSTAPCVTKIVKNILGVCQPVLSRKVLTTSVPWQNAVSLILLGKSGSGKGHVLEALSQILHLELHWINGMDLKSETSGATESKIHRACAGLQSNSIAVITNFSVITKGHEGESNERVAAFLRSQIEKLMLKQKFILIGVDTSKEQLSMDDWTLFPYSIMLEHLDSTDRKSTLEWLISYTAIEELDEELLNMLTYRTAGFVLRDLKELVSKISREFSNVNRDVAYGIKDIIEISINEMQKKRSESLGLPQVPTVKWKDIGGLEEAKKELISIIQLPILHPELVSSNVRSSGVVLYGPPGTGKTLLAKSVASECGLNFMSVKGPELLNMYVGQSEQNVREVFSKATLAAPCVIFFDELDSLAPNRGKSGDSGGVMDRIVSALLAELDGISSSSDVFVLAATNRPDLLDPALLRPGRFEKQLYLGVCEEDPDRLKILEAVFAKIPLDKSVSLKNLLPHIPRNLTGADFAALANDAFYRALSNVITNLPEGSNADDATVLVSEEDILEAASTLVPSVTQQQLDEYKQMKQKKT